MRRARSTFYLQGQRTHGALAKLPTKEAEQKRLDWAEGNFKQGLVFKMTRLGLLMHDKQQYLHCLLKVVVDLQRSNMGGVLAKSSGGTSEIGISE